MRPYFQTEGVALYHADSMQLLPTLNVAVDAVITDPPYCSGAATSAAKTQDPRQKYCRNGNDCGRPTFGGDAKDQRSFQLWCVLWLGQCRRLVKPGGLRPPRLPEQIQASHATLSGWGGGVT